MSENQADATPARLYALLIGGLLVLGGISGFLYESSFGTGDGLASDEIARTLATNGWLNLLHLLTGAAGLALASRAARVYALAAGGLFCVIAVWGFLEVEDGFGALFDVIPLNGADNWLHLLVGVTGIGAGLATQASGTRSPRPRPARSV